jgi:hypothetical protein
LQTARYYHSATHIGDGKILIFGGRVEKSENNDVFVLDTKGDLKPKVSNCPRNEVDSARNKWQRSLETVFSYHKSAARKPDCGLWRNKQNDSSAGPLHLRQW